MQEIKNWTDLNVLVTGGTGFLGQHVRRALAWRKPKKLVSVGSADFDLTDLNDVKRLFTTHRPHVVFHLAGLVGGILDNKLRPADYFYQNLMLGTLLLDQAQKFGVERFIAAGAGCGYPENAPLPLKESDLWAGFPQFESAPYSLAKRLLTIQAEAYFRQHGFQSVICIPGNIYGEFDNFNLQQAHVIPALVRKFIEAKREDATEVEVWGDGSPTRDFVYAGDVATGMVRAAEVCTGADVINLSSGAEISIRQVCEILQKVVGFEGRIHWNSSKPSGQKRRMFDVSKAQALLGFTAPTSIEQGLQQTVTWYHSAVATDEVRL